MKRRRKRMNSTSPHFCVKEAENVTTIHKDIYTGSKSLSVDISPENGTATIRFGTRTPRWLYPRKQGETTEIFHKAEKVLYSVASSLRTSLLLRFDTANTNLKQWILANGEQLGFDSVDPPSARAYRITVHKIYQSSDDNSGS